MNNREQDAPKVLIYDKEHLLAVASQHWTCHWLDTLVDPPSERLMQTIRVGVIVLDEQSGNERIESLVRTYSTIFWVAVLSKSALGNDHVRLLLKNYFYDFHTLPVDITRLQHTIGHALGMAELCYKKTSEPRNQGSSTLLSDSQSMQLLKLQIDKAARCPLPVLITGESGTGKELVARKLHARSVYAQGPFIAVNCGALSPQLVQSELLGHEKGAVTGAGHRKIGKFEAAHQGTLFLDEVGDLPLEEQANLLQFLQEKTIERVGSHQPIHPAVRVVAATHVDLELAVKEGRFREDLYFRLNVIRLEIPPLRQRGEDVLLLARAFLRQESTAQRMGFSEQAAAAMLQYHWPGNVRELMNRVQRANVMAGGRYIQPHDLDLEVANTVSHGTCLREIREVAERDALSRALDQSQGKASLVAKQLNISRATLYRLLGKHSLL